LAAEATNKRQSLLIFTPLIGARPNRGESPENGRGSHLRGRIVLRPAAPGDRPQNIHAGRRLARRIGGNPVKRS
jgi:hypothetical protein